MKFSEGRSLVISHSPPEGWSNCLKTDSSLLLHPLLTQQPHRPEQTRLHQRRVGLVRAVDGECVFVFCVRLQISDDAIRPEIGNLDFYIVQSRLQSRCHFQCEWRLPQDVWYLVTVQGYLGELADASE